MAFKCQHDDRSSLGQLERCLIIDGVAVMLQVNGYGNIEENSFGQLQRQEAGYFKYELAQQQTTFWQKQRANRCHEGFLTNGTA